MATQLTGALKLKSDIPYYDDFLSPLLKNHLLASALPYKGVEGLCHIGETGGLESAESLAFVCELYENVKSES
jgi:hypothetical protein